MRVVPLLFPCLSGLCSCYLRIRETCAKLICYFPVIIVCYLSVIFKFMLFSCYHELLFCRYIWSVIFLLKVLLFFWKVVVSFYFSAILYGTTKNCQRRWRETGTTLKNKRNKRTNNRKKGSLFSRYLQITKKQEVFFVAVRGSHFSSHHPSRHPRCLLARRAATVRQ